MNQRLAHLELPIPPGRRGEWAKELAQTPPAEGPAQHERFFVIRLGAEWFGLPPEILTGTQPDIVPVRLPHRTRSLIEGVVNSDGRVILCLAIERLLEVLPGGEQVDAPRLLTLQGQKWNCAFRVRQVLGLEELDLTEMQPLTASAGEVLRQSARGVVLHEGRAVVCLEAGAFLSKLQEAVR